MMMPRRRHSSLRPSTGTTPLLSRRRSLSPSLSEAKVGSMMMNIMEIQRFRFSERFGRPIAKGEPICWDPTAPTPQMASETQVADHIHTVMTALAIPVSVQAQLSRRLNGRWSSLLPKIYFDSTDPQWIANHSKECLEAFLRETKRVQNRLRILERITKVLHETFQSRFGHRLTPTETPLYNPRRSDYTPLDPEIFLCLLLDATIEQLHINERKEEDVEMKIGQLTGPWLDQILTQLTEAHHRQDIVDEE